MNRKWDGFMCSTSDRYKVYLYLVTAHHLGMPILSALNHASAFRGERFWLDAFVRDLGSLLRQAGWRGNVWMREDSNDGEWYGGFDRGGWTITIREDPCLSVRLGGEYNHGIWYMWREGYRITRNKMAITREELLERILRDIRFNK